MWPTDPTSSKRRVKKKLSLPEDKVCFLTPHREALKHYGGIVSESDSEGEARDKYKRSVQPCVDLDDQYGKGIVIHHTLDLPTKKKKKSPKESRILPTINRLSGEVHIKDVIAQMRTDTTNSLLYMNYALPIDHKDYSPFSFRIVTFWDINKDKFLTVSNKGVIIGGGSQPVFYSLDVWEKQYDDWAKLIMYRTFKNFQLFKYFVLWHKKVSRKRYVKRKNSLESRLIYTRPELREALMKVQAISCALADLSFFTATKLEKSTLKYFLKAQSIQCGNTLRTFQEGRDIIRQLLHVAAYGDLLDLGFLPDDSNKKLDESPLQRESTTSTNRLGWPVKRPPYKMSYADALNKKNECKKITSSLCVADYQIQQCLMSLLHNSLQQFLDAMKSQVAFLPDEEYFFMCSEEALDEIIEPPRLDGPKNPLFFIDLLLGEDTLEFEPGRRTWELSFRHVTNMWEETVMKVKPLQGEDIFKPFTVPTICGFQEDPLCGYGPKIKDTIKNDRDYEEKVNSLIELLEMNLRYIDAYSKRFIAIREKTIANIELDRTIITDETALEAFKQLVVTYSNDEQLMNSICRGQPIGAFFVNLDNFRDEVVPLVQNLKELVMYTMAKVGTERVNEALTEVMGALEYLEMEPQTTVNFVEYLAYLDTLAPRMEEINLELDYLDELYALMEDFKVDLAGLDVKRHRDLGFQFSDLQEALEKAQDKRAETVNSFNETILKDFEGLMEEVMAINSKATESWLTDINSEKTDVMKTLANYSNQLQKLLERFEQFNNYQRQVKVPVTRLDTLLDVINHVKIRKLIWESMENWNRTEEEWMSCDFEDLDPEVMQQEIAVYMKNINSIIKSIGSNALVEQLKARVENMISKLPVITTLRNPNLKQRHWQRIEELIGYTFDPKKIISLTLFDELDVYKYDVELAEISGQASSEASLEAILKKVEDTWKSLEFIVVTYKDIKDVFILAGLEEIQTALDETNINLSTITSSRNVGPIKTRVMEWIKNIDVFSKTLDEWTKCQTNWMYLEPIFSAPDIQRQLPTEAKLFFIVDKSWKEIMKNVAKNPLALKAATIPGLYEAFVKNNEYLEQILKCLEAYLESKRVVFPRFYFLSNEELLEILAQTRNPLAVQPHLRKCFDAIARLEFGVRKVLGDDKAEGIPTNDIKAMISPEGEIIQLGKGLKARGNVEQWLGHVESSMFSTLWLLMKACIKDFLAKTRKEWVLNHASQLILTVSQIMWVRGVHAVLTDKVSIADALNNFEQKVTVRAIRVSTQLGKLKESILLGFDDLNDLAGMVRGELTHIQREVLKALITVDVHARDIISGLVYAKVRHVSNFDWVKQLRYYWEKRIDNCVACMATARHVYGYEYLGATPRLVITPLTDKCYLCLMGALQLDLGGAPAGPAGTGKTETTKDLAKSLAVMCVVFNCSDGLDYKIMGRFFSGLAQSGAWCCFDEFNRIDIEVLSVIAQQLITIKNAKVAKVKRFMFEGREIKLIPSCAAFITMNPGYAGRTELPDNLKSLFRPMAMMVPDYGLIAEVTLYSEGFETSKILAQKMVNMYKLCSEQLSHQDHYDFGMRAVKSVLVMAGSLKRQNPDKREDVVLIRALRDSNLPKFLADDVILFGGILGDLFPGVVLPSHDYGEFQKAMEFVLKDTKLQPVSVTFVKTIQLYETMVVRWGVMTVGPTGGGKTTVLNVLKNTLTRLHDIGVQDPLFRPVTSYTLNPKSVTMGELYGEVNLQTMEWRDGLLGIFVRTAVNCTDERHQWVVCDGPVDAVWIENMNTVLDDNKLLCLSNSERIKLTPWVHMVFEVQDLSQASPATVSRCGMVYIDPDELRWMPYVISWAQNFKVKEHFTDFLYNTLVAMFEEHVDKGLKYIKKNCPVGIPQVDISKIAMMCSLIEYIITKKKSPTKYMDVGMAVRMFYLSFIFSYMWSLGGNLLDEPRDVFELHCKELFKSILKDSRFDTSKSLFDVFYDTEDSKLKLWSDIVEPFVYNKKDNFSNMIVPTMDTVRFGSVMTYLLEVNHPVLLTGQTGVGKSVVAKEVLENLSQTGLWVPTTLNFSAQTSSMRTQEMIESKLERKKKTVLGAPIGKRIVVFVDDVNMPKLEVYGAQPPIELLRQFLDFGGLYDRERLFWKQLQNVVLCAGCAPPGGGRNPLTPRFTRHFGMLYIPSPSESALRVIFKSIIQGFLNDFGNAIKALSEGLVLAAITVYKRLAQDLLPTPAKSHYVFNLRDLSKCVQGILQANSDVMRDPKDMLRLFFHENLRVYHDRLVDIEDKSYFYRLLSNTCHSTFHDKVLELPAKGNIVSPPQLLFGDFLMQQPKENRAYEEITNVTKLRNVLQDFLSDYNILRGKDMKLIFFMDALEHVCRLARILRNERGNGLLVGVGGMGKQSLTRLSSHINSCRDFQIEITRNYDYNAFHEDLRKICFTAGAKYEDSVFLFTDTQIVQEEFLEDINNLLNSGEVPNLFESDEYEKVIIACRGPAKQAGLNESNRDVVYEFFISRVKSKLHLVICMSPVGEAFRRRCRMFPSLVNCCTIDWFTTWPEEALRSVAQNTLQQVLLSHSVENLASVCYTMHSSVESMTVRFYTEMKRHYYVTPSSYLDLLKLYSGILKLKSDQVSYQKNRISNGLKKLFETNELVNVMQKQILHLEPILLEKSEATEQLMISVAKEKAAADEVKQVVLVDESAAKEVANECQALADDAQKDLDQALPAMEAAVKALEALNKNDINEIRVFLKPPHLVKYTLEAVCLLLGAKQDWASAKVVLGDGNFLKKLQEYDKNNISDVMMKKLKPFIENPQFVPDVVATQSKACKSLCMWVRAIDTYAKVYRVVEPKKKKVDAAEKQLNSIMAVLRSKQQHLANVEAQIAQLEARYDKSIQEKSSLEATMTLCAARLNRAGRLTSALADEQVRWEQLIVDLTEELNNVVGDCLLAAGSVAYLGPFTNDFREELVKIWLTAMKNLSVAASANFSMVHVLADDYRVREWNRFGLPRDKVSVENGIFVTNTTRWPLMIDPQEQANRWIRQMEAENNLKMIKMTDASFMRQLEGAIRLGLPVLIWEVGETLDPSLTPILLKQVFTQGGRLIIKLGDTDIEYDPNFKLYITTKMPNPHYLPEICIQVTIVNFTVTPSGLEDQLLVDVVSNERPELEEQRTELIIRINRDKATLLSIEDRILKLLFASQGNILDDEELIETLNESKETSAIISARLMEAEETEEKISVAREAYRTVATRGSCLYFVVAQLGLIDPMYQFSLKYFNMIFNMVIKNAPKKPTLDERLKRLIDDITLTIYSNVSRGLFEKDKLVYSFMLCASILMESKEIPEDDWQFLIRGAVISSQEVPRKPDISTLSELNWQNTCYLDLRKPAFKGLMQAAVKNTLSVSIGDYTLDIALVKNAPPSPVVWNDRLDLFQRMMLIKALREEKVIFAISEYVKLKMGKEFVESPIVNLHILFEDTSKVTPLVFILSSGSDPVAAFLRFASDTGNLEKVHSISLGQGQGPIAQRMIERGKVKGDWVFLQNCHLAASWMLTMENIIADISDNPSDVHNNFRLFLSSMQSNKFPVSVLQNAVKVTNEPPKGIRANVKKAFLDMQDDYFDDHPLDSKWRKMVFGICFFHAVILERKKFGPLGWNIGYEFSESDRECALLNLKLYCQDGKHGIPWDALMYITGEITYGGRVTDYWDQRTLKTILVGFFSPQTLAEGYAYSASGTYHCPEDETCKNIAQYRQFIENLPLIEEPEIFGMHENANIAFQTKETAAVLVTIMNVQPQKAGKGEGKSSDVLVFEMAAEIDEKISKKIDQAQMKDVLQRRDSKGRLASLSTVLLQEIDRFNKLLKVIHNSLSDLQKAIKGLVVMSDALEGVYTAFLTNTIPKIWGKVSYPSLKSLGSWTRDLELRIDFIDTWLKCGIPQSFWLSGFFFPQGFMTGVLQTHARKYDLPIDQLKIDFEMTPTTLVQEHIYTLHKETGKEVHDAYKGLQQPEDGVLVHGLFLDAAKFDTQNMVLSDPNPGEVNPPLPAMALVPVTERPSVEGRYESPLYKTSVRAGVLSTTGHSTNFVITVLLPSAHPQSYWILKGTALLTQVTD